MEKSAATICNNFVLGDVAKNLLTPNATTDQYLDLLVQNKQFVDAVRVLAYALPAKTAVAWATWCARRFAAADEQEKYAVAFTALDRWLAESTDENRRATMKAAQEVQFGTPAGSAALAAFFSGGNIAPEGAPHIEPQPNVSPNSVVGSVLLAIHVKEPEKAEEKYQVFIAEGRRLASQT